MSKESHCLDKTNSTAESSNYNDDHLDADELEWPRLVNVGEETEPKIREDESLSSKSNALESHCWYSLTLGRKTVPGVVSHDDTWCKQRNDTRLVEYFSDSIGNVTEREDKHTFLDWWGCYESQMLQQETSKESTAYTNTDWDQSQ